MSILLGVPLLAASVAMFAWLVWLFLPMLKPEEDWESCNRVMGTTFNSSEEYEKSNYGCGMDEWIKRVLPERSK